MNLTYKSIPIEIEIKGYQPPVSGSYSGSNENSYPDEPEEFEFEIVGVEIPRVKHADWIQVTNLVKEVVSDRVMTALRFKNQDLTDQERGEIEQLILNKREKDR